MLSILFMIFGTKFSFDKIAWWCSIFIPVIIIWLAQYSTEGKNSWTKTALNVLNWNLYIYLVELATKCLWRIILPQKWLQKTFSILCHCQSSLWDNIDYTPSLLEKFLPTPMGVLATGSGHARPSARPPIYMSGNFPAHMSAESPSNISSNTSEVISDVSEPYDNFWNFQKKILKKPKNAPPGGQGGSQNFLGG